MHKDLQNNKGWTVVFSAAGITFTGGIIYAWSVISNGLIQKYNWTSMQASLPYTALTIAFVAAMVIFGQVQDKKGPQICAALSGILIGSGILLSGFVRTPWLMVLTFGIIAGTGVGITNAVGTPPALKWFPPGKKGLVSGIVVAGAGLAPVFYSPAANILIKHLGISGTFISIGIFALVVILLLSRNIKNPLPREAGTIQQAQQQNTQTSGNDAAPLEMIKNVEFYNLWIILAFSASAGLMIIAHTTTIAYVQTGWDGGYLLVILLAVFNAVGRLAGGTISDSIGRMNLMRLVFGLQFVNMLAFGSFTTVPMLAAGIATAGLCYGATFSVFPATVADAFGLKNFGANYGLIFTAWGVSGIIGPISAASIFDTTGSYYYAYLIAAVQLVVSFMLTFTIGSDKAVQTKPAIHISSFQAKENESPGF